MTCAEAKVYLDEFLPIIRDIPNDRKIVIDPPFTAISTFSSHSDFDCLDISSQNKVPGTFALFIRLNPNRKHSINKRSLLNMITVLNSLYKKNLHKCIFYNTNKYFRIIYGTIRPILDTNLKKKFLFVDYQCSYHLLNNILSY